VVDEAVGAPVHHGAHLLRAHHRPRQPATVALLEPGAVEHRVTAAARSLPSNDSRANSIGSSAPGRGNRSFSRPSLCTSTSPVCRAALAVHVGADPGPVRLDRDDGAAAHRDQRVVQDPVGEHRPHVAEHVVRRRGTERPVFDRRLEQSGVHRSASAI